MPMHYSQKATTDEILGENGLEVSAYVVRKTPAGELYTVIVRLDDDSNIDPIVETGWAVYAVENGIRDWMGDFADRDSAAWFVAGQTGRTFKSVRDEIIAATPQGDWALVKGAN